MHYTLFISDLHLQSQRADITALLEKFLHTHAGKADALYILGDLFEAWIGDDAQTDFTRQIQASLAALQIPVYFMRGNRDFLIGEQFARQSNCHLLEDPCNITVYDKPVALSHGDILCTQDRRHQLFRKFAHNPKLNRFYLYLPVTLRRWLAEKIRKASRKHTKTTAYEIMDVVPEAVQGLLAQKKAQLLIHGHTHRPAIHQQDANSVRIVLGDWHKKGSALFYYEDGSYQLTSFT